jgi:hypothetical protein
MNLSRFSAKLHSIADYMLINIAESISRGDVQWIINLATMRLQDLLQRPNVFQEFIAGTVHYPIEYRKPYHCDEESNDFGVKEIGEREGFDLSH